MRTDQSSGSIRSASVTEPTTSAKSAVTGLRSPATWRDDGGGAADWAGWATAGVPHAGQNRAAAGRSAPQLAHRSVMVAIVDGPRSDAAAELSCGGRRREPDP